MKEHLNKNLGLCPLQVIQFLGLVQCFLNFKYGYVLPFLFLYFLNSFLHITYPTGRHITRFFLSPCAFPEVSYTVLRWCFLYHNLVFSYFSTEFFGIRLKDFILPVKFVTFIKSSFPLRFYLYFLL